MLRYICGDSAQICQQKQHQPSNLEEKQQLGKWRVLVFSVQKLSSKFKAKNTVVGFLVYSQVLRIGLVKQDVGIVWEKAERI